ncbi:gliding motility protein RemB [Pedobacter sp. MC2016-14]|uniref:gliding motility protein RemB n=1 Tax=Pedobacter sp. MC2016-14 TaxID=2897327 RepID=UPI001E2ACCD4|nr:gliding motility protein RemB [Pedobacter sp. MC2016-14]MCD0486881.1 gliding motility protein RemB [Pedobacter sp. MC2016-14]
MKKIFAFCLSLMICAGIKAQDATPNQNLPYAFSFYQKFNKQVYDPNTRMHSSIKNYYADEPLLAARYGELMNLGVDSLQKRSWLRRKLTDEHLLNFKAEDYTIYADFLPDFQIGNEFEEGKNIWKNTRGYQVGGTVGKTFSFYTNGYENQAVFANYLTEFINTNQVVPSEMSGKFENETKDWSYVTANVSYTPNKYLNFTLAYDKNFIGDGYRSMLLSDVAANHSFFRMRANLGNVQYQTIFSYMLDNGAERLTADRRLGARGKWNAMHYIDWNVSNRFSLGFFQAVTWSDVEKEGKRGFDFNYIHPFVFLRPIEGANGNSPDKMRLGLNTKYELSAKTVAYGQFMFDEFTASEAFSNKGYWANKWSAQLGIRGSDLFKTEALNYLVEFNTARPYTYAHYDRITSYTGMSQPLAHPMGANFREFLGILNYSYKRFDFQLQGSYAQYGLDPAGLNYGKNILLSYDVHVSDYGNTIAQGIKTNLYFGEAKASYLLNPKYNLRIELGGVYRQEKNELGSKNTQIVNIGLRSTFRNLYQDF